MSAALSLLLFSVSGMQQPALFGAAVVGRLHLFVLTILAALLLDGPWVWPVWNLLTLMAIGIALGVAAALIPPSLETIIQLTQPARLPAWLFGLLVLALLY